MNTKSMIIVDKKINHIYDEYENTLKELIKYQISKYRNKYSFMSGMGVYFFNKNGSMCDDEDLPSGLKKIIMDIDILVQKYNFYPSFNVN